MPRRAGMHIRVIHCFGSGAGVWSLHIAAPDVCTIIRQIAHFAGIRGSARKGGLENLTHQSRYGHIRVENAVKGGRMKGVFGRKQSSQGSASSGGGPNNDAPTQAVDFPWRDKPDSTACNFAFGHLRDNLPRLLTVDGRIHAETIVSAAGAIAGFAAQCALISGGTPELQIATTKDGSRFLFGEPLNEMLFARDGKGASERLWNLAAGTAINSGLSAGRVPSMEAMFAHVSRTLGGPLDGLPSVDKSHHPHFPVRKLLGLVWPAAVTCLTGRLPNATFPYGEADVSNWPAITANVAALIVGQVKDVLDPALSLTIVMESAIYASKLDPKVVSGQTPATGYQ
jgi:hypothetical protein